MNGSAARLASRRRPSRICPDDISAAGNALLDESEVGGAQFIEAACNGERWGDHGLHSSQLNTINPESSLIPRTFGPRAPVIDDSDDPGRDGILTVGAALLILLLLAVALPTSTRLGPRAPLAERPERQAGRSPWRILIGVVVLAMLGSLAPVGVVYARRPPDPGVTPLYIGAQPARDPGSVIIGAAGDIACPSGRRRNTPNACGMEGTAKVLEAIRPDAVLTLGDHQYPSGSRADFEASYAETWGGTAISPSRCRATMNMKRPVLGDTSLTSASAPVTPIRATTATISAPGT